MDFITKLPLLKELATRNFYNSILIIIDRLIKFSYFIPYRELIIVKEFTYFFYFYITKIYGLLLEIIID
jgi:hypothetical protein